MGALVGRVGVLLIYSPWNDDFSTRLGRYVSNFDQTNHGTGSDR